jgi:hypothetical protein
LVNKNMLPMLRPRWSRAREVYEGRVSKPPVNDLSKPQAQQLHNTRV